MPEVDVTSEVLIDCPLEWVAAYSADPDKVPHWYVNITSVQWKTPRPAAVGSRIAFVAHFMGRRLEYTYEIAELVPGKRLVMRTWEGPFPMETSYSWDASAGLTRMTLRNRGRSAGFSGLLSPFMAFMMRRANRKDLLLLKRVLEQGA